MSHHRAEHESHIWAKMTYGMDRCLTWERWRVSTGGWKCAQKEKGENKWNITESKRNLFKQHIRAHIKHTTRRGRLLSGSHLAPLPLCSFCSVSCSSRFALFSLYCLPLRHLNILYVAWCCVRDVSHSLIRHTVIDLLLEQSKALTVSSQRKRQWREAHWTKTNQ